MGREGEKDTREKHWSVASCTCPDRESNPQSFTLWDEAQPTEPHRLGPKWYTFKSKWDTINNYTGIIHINWDIWSPFS